MSDVKPSPPTPLSGMSLDMLRDWMRANGEKPFRAAQVHRAVQVEGRLDPEDMTNLPIALRTRLAEAAPPATTIVEVQTSEDGTAKFLLALADGNRIESVLIPEGKRQTVCVSSQVGCPIGCIFCASGVGGVIRNLTTAEMVEQVLRVHAHIGQRPSNIVVMGMGEPMLNLPALADAIRAWTDPEGMGFSARRITVSTAGVPAKVDQLAEMGLGVNIAISLHAADDETRARLVPGSPAGRTQGLTEAAARYARKTGRDATVEYVLIAGFNDKLEHAGQLAALVKGRHIHVNLIPLNPVSHRPDLRAPSLATSRAFAARLEGAGASVTLRSQRGDDIAAACGQLALERALAPK
jgi:23S rRNA (adenine2503-C2)-methyltransferase